MTDRVLIRLSENWAFGHDANQWIVTVHRGSRWRSIAFVASNKGVLIRALEEKGAVTPEARAALDTLPATFGAWLVRQVPQVSIGRAV